MAEIDYTYTPGGASLTTQGGPLSGLSGAGMPNMSWLLEQARLRAEREAAYRAAEEARKAQMFKIQATSAQDALNRSRGLGGPGAEGDRTLANAKQGAELAAFESRRAGPPMKYIAGPGIVGGYTPDVERMNYYDRQNYLPQNASFANGGMSPEEEANAKAEATMRMMREQARLDEEKTVAAERRKE